MASQDEVVMENVSWRYEKGEEFVLKDINLKFSKGEVTVITGQSGAGKTTLCRCINGLIPHFFEGELKGDIVVAGRNVRKFDISRMSGKVGMCFDNPSNQLFCSTVVEEIAFGPENLCLPREEIRTRVYDAIDFLRLRGYEDKSPHSLSGGEKQSTAIAATVAMRPDIFILDEPTSNIDPYGTDLVFQRIRSLIDKEKKTMIIVEHKLEYALPLADKLVIMSEGEVVTEGPAREVIAEAELLTELDIQIPHVTQLAYALGDIPEDGSIPITFDEGRTLLGKFAKKKDIKKRATRLGAEAIQREPKDLIIACHDVWFQYPDGTEALRGITLEIREEEFVGIIGRNGSGKSTLAKLFNGLYRPSRGTVSIAGTDTKDSEVGLLARVVGYSFQNPDDQIFAKTIRKELEYGPTNLMMSPEVIESRVDRVSKDLDLVHLLDRSPFSVSQGLRQRVAVASVLTMEPKVLIIDEPATGQDLARAKVIMGIAQRLNQAGRTIVVISHNMDLIAQYCDRVIVMLDGKLLLDGQPRQVFSQPEILAESSIKPPQVTRLGQAFPDSGLPPDVLTVDEMLGIISTSDT
ncbi:MAG: ABC transporter ATP-binding protein [Candidatus Geothermarchaeales archaeon]